MTRQVKSDKRCFFGLKLSHGNAFRFMWKNFRNIGELWCLRGYVLFQCLRFCLLYRTFYSCFICCGSGYPSAYKPQLPIYRKLNLMLLFHRCGKKSKAIFIFVFVNVFFYLMRCYHLILYKKNMDYVFSVIFVVVEKCR